MHELIELRKRVEQWLADANRDGWVDDAHAERLAGIEAATPDELFASATRPLVVALLGGTGVGKSSLLNRLVGEPLARTGVQRPTSHELTAYLHRDVDLAKLPDALPADKLQVGRHQDGSLRDVMLLDMPDIDSTAEENRALVFEWLARIDLLVYVVSPERYRDDVGWSVLRERGHRHGWLFVMNQWDLGDVRQRDDLERLLQSAGFDAPLVFCTSCQVPLPQLPSPDQFDEMMQHLRDLRATHEIEELTRLGIAARCADLRGWLDEAAQPLRSQPGNEPTRLWQAPWERFGDGIREGVDFPIRSAAGQFAQQEGAVLAGWLDAVRGRGNKPAPAAELPGRLGALAEQTWDAWAETRLAETVDAFSLELGRNGHALRPYQAALERVVERGNPLARQTIESTLRTRLSQPGGTLQRWLRRGLGALTVLLPLAAIAWVAWGVLHGYYRATTGEAAFLGTPFAIHSGLLVFVSWLIPFGLDRLTRPSLAQQVDRGLRAGIDDALRVLDEACAAELASVFEEQKQLAERAEVLLQATDFGSREASGDVRRMVMTAPSQ